MLQIRKILFQVSDFTRYVTERSRDVRVNPLTRGISINLSSVSMASHISPTAVHVDSPDPIQIAFKEPENSFIIFYREENNGELGWGCLHASLC